MANASVQKKKRNFLSTVNTGTTYIVTMATAITQGTNVVTRAVITNDTKLFSLTQTRKNKKKNSTNGRIIVGVGEAFEQSWIQEM